MGQIRFKVPHTFIILLFFIIFMSALSYIIPPGSYERVVAEDGRTVLNPESFKYIAKTPVTLMQFLTAIPQGFVDTSYIIAFTLCTGAGIAVVQRIGVIPAVIEFLATKFKDKGIVVIPLLMCAIAAVDAFIASPELCIIYIPIIMPLMLRLGFDSVTACATALCASATGFSAAIANPFTIAIGQKISGLPLYSGWEFRIFTFVVTLLIGIIYVMRYARKVHKNPELSLVYEEDKIKREHLLSNSNDEKIVLNLRTKIAGVFSVIVLFATFYGVLGLGWDLPEMCAMFLVMGAGAGVIAGLDGNSLCDTMVDGCKDMMFGSLMIGVARGISIVMTHGNITDTVVHFFADLLQSSPASLTAIGILLVVTCLNFLIPSGSGKAVILFPILSPLADVVGITRQTAVLAYQFGDGFSNNLYPTNGIFMACIGAAGIPYQKWARFFFPLFLIWTLASVGYLIIAQIIHYGPF